MNPATSELITSVMLTFPCPPLPMLGGRADGQEAILNTHDLIATCMLGLLKRNDEAMNNERRVSQTRLENEYMQKLVKYKNDSDINHIYNAMMEFTRRYIMLYFPAATMDVRILPYDHAPDHILSQVHSYTRGRQILMKTPPNEDNPFNAKDAYFKCATTLQYDLSGGVGKGVY